MEPHYFISLSVMSNLLSEEQLREKLRLLFNEVKIINKQNLSDEELRILVFPLVDDRYYNPPKKTGAQAKDILLELQKTYSKFLSVVLDNRSVLSFEYRLSVMAFEPSLERFDLTKLSKATSKKKEALKNNDMIDCCCTIFHITHDTLPTYSKDHETPFSKFLNAVADVLDFKVRNDRVIERIAHFKKEK